MVVVPLVVHNGKFCGFSTSPKTKKKFVRIMGNINYLFSCMVLPELRFASSDRNMVLRMVILSLLAACISIETGIKFCGERPFF